MHYLQIQIQENCLIWRDWRYCQFQNDSDITIIDLKDLEKNQRTKFMSADICLICYVRISIFLGLAVSAFGRTTCKIPFLSSA